METPWLPTFLIMFEDIPQHCPVVKDLSMDVSVGQVLKGLQYLSLTLWLLRDMCCTDKGSLPQSWKQWQEQLECLQQMPTINVGKNGKVVVLEKVYQLVPYLPLN